MGPILQGRMASTSMPSPNYPFLQMDFLRPQGIAAWGYTENLTAQSYAYFHQWQQSTANPFPYLRKDPAQRQDLKHLLSDAQSALVFILPYVKAKRRYLPLTQTAGGRVSGHSLAYRGLDYHLVGRQALQAVTAKMQACLPAPLEVYAGIDTKPVLEKDLAVRAHLGFIGRHGLLQTPYWGSYVFLAYLILNQTLALPSPCNSYALASSSPSPSLPSSLPCAACPGFCQQACPVARWPHNDVGKCLAAVTIEKAVPLTSQTQLHHQILGCDRCQDACPLNQKVLAEVAEQDEVQNPLLAYQDHFPQYLGRDLNTFFQKPLDEIYQEVLPLSKRGFQQEFRNTILAYVGKDKFQAVLQTALAAKDG